MLEYHGTLTLGTQTKHARIIWFIDVLSVPKLLYVDLRNLAGQIPDVFVLIMFSKRVIGTDPLSLAQAHAHIWGRGLSLND